MRYGKDWQVGHRVDGNRKDYNFGKGVSGFLSFSLSMLCTNEVYTLHMKSSTAYCCCC